MRPRPELSRSGSPRSEGPRLQIFALMAWFTVYPKWLDPKLYDWLHHELWLQSTLSYPQCLRNRSFDLSTLLLRLRVALALISTWWFQYEGRFGGRGGGYDCDYDYGDGGNRAGANSDDELINNTINAGWLRLEVDGDEDEAVDDNEAE